MRAKNFIKASFLFTTFFFVTSCSETEKVEPVVNQQQSSLKTNYDLPEVTIIGYNTYDTNLFDDIYTLYVGADYRISSNPYRALTEEYAGIDINSVPDLIMTVIYRINQMLIAAHKQGLNDAEMLLIKNKLDVPEALKLGAILLSSGKLNDKLTATTFNGEGSDDGFANAVTHVYMANRSSRMLKDERGKEYMDAHEYNQDNIHSKMDKLNNQVGIDFMGWELSEKTIVEMTIYSKLWSLNSRKELGQWTFYPKKPLDTHQN